MPVRDCVSVPALFLASALSGELSGQEAPAPRCLVHFAKRSFDLVALREAVAARRPASEADRIIAEFEARARADQAPFARVVEALGGRVVTHWWIINACLVAAPPAVLDQLGTLPNVTRIEPDSVAVPANKDATNSYNHDADAVQAQGLIGRGVTVAVMDTGLDENMRGSGRPHRTFFVNGDPNNMTGGGIGGSRLVVNRALGTMPADDVAGHGTWVAGVAAGARWGTAGADDGHAPGAWVAGYSIAHDVRGNTTIATMVSAWQAIAADRVTFNIVSAVNSYLFTTFSNPTSAVQQAVDSVALNADVLVCVPAGNNPTNSCLSHSATNGLAVGAVSADSHAVTNFSTRGPLCGDSQRFYPDLAAVGFNVVSPLFDCETMNGTVIGTSFAAPQVCGAAALLRSAVPSLRADETKAILLAGTIDISARNPDPPYNSRNAYGLGLLHDAIAMTAALDPARHGRSQVTASVPSVTLPMSVTQGTEYAFAIAWHRTDLTSTNWSNLDLRILDGTTVVGSSTTPRNLYEMVRFRAARTGTLVAEVTATSLAATAQDFAFALAAHPSTVASAGLYTAFGVPCSGTGSSAGAGTRCVGANDNVSSLPGYRPASNVYIAFKVTAPTSMTVSGFELLTYCPIAQPMSTWLYDVDGAGLPLEPPVRTGSMWLGTQTAWHRTSFAPWSVASGQSFYIAFLTPDPSSAHSYSASGSTDVEFAIRRACDTGWSHDPSGTTERWVYRVVCGSGPANAAPLLWNQGAPIIAASFQANLAFARPNAAAVLLTGISRTAWETFTLPLDLGTLGAPGCSVYASGELMFGLVTDAVGAGSTVIGIPNGLGFVGARVYQQYVVLDSANALGLVTTHGAAARVGTPP